MSEAAIELDRPEIERFTIRDCIVTVLGVTPYSASRQPGEEKAPDETWDEYYNRVWKRMAHVDQHGEVFVPGSAFKLCLDEATQNLNEKVPGKGHQTWTGIFRMGVAPISNMPLGIGLDDLRQEWVYCHASGKRGPGTRVMRAFPMVDNWRGSITMRVFNDSITQAKFEEFFGKAGLLAGVGRGRPSTGCPMGNGRFKPVEFRWSVVE